MDTTKKQSKFKKGLSIFLACTVLFSSLGYAKNSSKNKATTDYTAEQYFKAIFFKKGDLATLIYKGELNEMVKDEYSAVEKADLQKLQNVIYSTITSKNPGFLAEFEREIKSKDLKAIEAAVNKGGDLLLKTMHALDRNSMKDNVIFQRYVSGTSTGATAEMQSCLIYTMGIVIYGYPVLGSIIYYYPMIIITMSMIEKDQKTQLYREQFVYNIYEVQK